MNRDQKLKALRIAIRALLIAMATALPIYSIATNITAPPVTPPVEQKLETAPASANAPAPAPAPAPGSTEATAIRPQPPMSSHQVTNHGTDPADADIDALSAFYQIVITLLVTLLALVAGLAYWTVKLISEAKAEEIAREAVRKMFADSREFHNGLTTAVEEALEEHLEEIRGRVADMKKDLEELTGAANVNGENVPETEVVTKGNQ
jgi:hypothetical protein